MTALVVIGCILIYIAVGIPFARYCFLANYRPEATQLKHGEIVAIWLLWPLAVMLAIGGWIFRNVIVRPRNEDSQDSSDKA